MQAVTLLTSTFFAIAAGSVVAAPAERAISTEKVARMQAQRLPQNMQLEVNYSGLRKLDPALFSATGEVEVLIKMARDPAAVADVALAGSGAGAKSQIMAEQTSFIARSHNRSRSFRVTGATQVAMNAVFARVDTSDLAALAADAEVERITMVRHYEMHLSETVPQIGAAAAQSNGVTGRGVTVAVLDAGIDYTHVAFGGGGTAADYAAAYGPIDGSGAEVENRDGLFPTSKVVDGFDFVGEQWPLGPRTEDNDPIAATDVGNFGGHGTHVADIIGGVSPGAPGVAPGVKFVAVKVCAAFSNSCNGVALIKGIEFAIDPNGDGRTRDHVDIINMSLGSDYGQAFDDDLAFATNIASLAGVLTVASAGNGGDIPFITGTPAGASSALSVAQTQVTSAVNPTAMQVLEPAGSAGNYEAVYQSWSAPLSSAFEGPVTYGDPGDAGNIEGCSPFTGAVSGIVMVDRGACNFTAKIANIQDAGGSLGIIGVVTPDAPFNGSDGGDRPASGSFDITGFMISQVDADIIRGGGAVVRFDPDVQFSDFNARMVNSSSRGPAYFDSALKPEIGAPGASVSASSSTGTGNTAFGGTSGASPMVAGAAALVMEAFPRRRPGEIKAGLMNTGEIDVVNSPAGDLAPISRIGGGEVRVDAALALPVAAWERGTNNGGLGFGQMDVDGTVTIEKRVTIRNFSRRKVKYKAKSMFRFDDDAMADAVSVKVIPSSITVRPFRSKTVRVRMKIDASKLPGNAMNDGTGGGNPADLTFNEVDGYILFESKTKSKWWKNWFRGRSGNGPRFDLMDPSQSFSMPWHVLPRKAANVSAGSSILMTDDAGFGAIELTNNGAGTAQNDIYSLLNLADTQPAPGPEGGQNPNPDVKAFGVQTVPVPDGFCSAEDGVNDYLMTFAYHYWERQALALYPGLAGIFLDVDDDGADDYDVFNLTLNFLGLAGDNRNVSVVTDLSTGLSSFFFFTEHATNTANQVLIICDSQIGTPPLFGQIASTVYVQDAYFGNSFNLTPTSWAPLGERYFAFNGVPDLEESETGTVDIFDFGAAGNNPTELGVMFFTNGDRGIGNRGGATEETEAVFVLAPAQ